MTNITFFDTANTIIDVFNGVIGQLPAFPFVVLGAVALVLFLTNINEDTKKVLMLEGWVISILSGLFVALGWLDINIMAIGGVAFVIGIFATLFMKKDY